jgi:uncharacterized membrane protein (UPF0127 family)
VLLVNGRSDETIASDIELALTRDERRRGLLGRTSLDPAGALVISPCWSIHTAFMKFAIDLIFVDRTGRAVRIDHAVRPWRIAVAPRAHAVIELPAGTLAARDLRIGDEIRLVPPPPQHRNVLRRPAVGDWKRPRVQASADLP